MLAILVTNKNSNTTLVKVKSRYIVRYEGECSYSNTTLVKVKFKYWQRTGCPMQEFKYNTC